MTQRGNAIGKMVPADSRNAGLPTNLPFVKKKIKHNTEADTERKLNGYQSGQG